MSPNRPDGARPRRPGADAVLAVVLPLACAAGLLLLDPDRAQPGGQDPVSTPLTSASVVCPGAVPGGTDRVGLTTLADPAADPTGEVTVGLGDAATPVRVRPGRVTEPPADAGPLVASGSGDLAPGLIAARSREAPVAATDCAPPRPVQWFTAVGAGATHDSVLELVNPGSGPAVADVTVRSGAGVLDVPALRGVTVPGGTTTSLDLGQVVPRRGELSLEVRTSRGRLAAHVLDTYDELGAGTRSQDWLAPQEAPADDNLLLGLAAGPGERTLVLANPGTDEVRATLKVVAPTSVFAPAGVDTVRVAPESTEAVSLDAVLQEAVAQGATGLLVETTGPVGATLRQVVDGDVSLVAPASPVGTATGAVLPPGPKRLLLAGPDAVGVATVEAYAADGKALATERVELAPGTGADVELPEGAALVRLTPERTSIRAAVLAQGDGHALVLLRDLVLTGLVPGVRPGVP